MKVSIEIERKFYKAKLEFANEEMEDFESRIEDTLQRLDETVRKSSRIWHTNVPSSLENLMEILPNGSARFHLLIDSQIDQVICATAVGGRGGVTSSEASILLDLPIGTVTGYYQQDAYKGLFRTTANGGFGLSSEGLNRLSQIQERLTNQS